MGLQGDQGIAGAAASAAKHAGDPADLAGAPTVETAHRPAPAAPAGPGRRLLRRWHEIHIGAPPAARRLVLEPAKRALLPVVHPLRRLRRLRGHNPAGPLTLSYYGRFKRNLLLPRKQFFAEHELEETSERVAFWRLGGAVRRDASDLVMIDGGHRLERALPRERALLLPARVRLIVDLRGGWEATRRRFHKSAKAKLRKARANGYSFRLGGGPGDFETFYEQMYLPAMRARHGDLTLTIPRLEAEVYFERGILLLLRHAGRDVAGALCHPQGKRLTAVCYGLLHGDMGSRREDRVGALQVLRLRWAAEAGFEEVDLRSVEPCLSSGLFNYKRQWGSRAELPGGPDNRLWLGVGRLTPAVRHCLEENPLVALGADGELEGLVVVPEPAALDEAARRRLRKRYATPGLRRLLLCATDSFAGPLQPRECCVEI